MWILHHFWFIDNFCRHKNKDAWSLKNKGRQIFGIILLGVDFFILFKMIETQKISWHLPSLKNITSVLVMYYVNVILSLVNYKKIYIKKKVWFWSILYSHLWILHHFWFIDNFCRHKNKDAWSLKNKGRQIFGIILLGVDFFILFKMIETQKISWHLPSLKNITSVLVMYYVNVILSLVNYKKIYIKKKKWFWSILYSHLWILHHFWFIDNFCRHKNKDAWRQKKNQEMVLTCVITMAQSSLISGPLCPLNNSCIYNAHISIQRGCSRRNILLLPQ